MVLKTLMDKHINMLIPLRLFASCKGQSPEIGGVLADRTADLLRARSALTS